MLLAFMPVGCISIYIMIWCCWGLFSDTYPMPIIKVYAKASFQCTKMQLWYVVRNFESKLGRYNFTLLYFISYVRIKANLKNCILTMHRNSCVTFSFSVNSRSCISNNTCSILQYIILHPWCQYNMKQLCRNNFCEP